MLIRKIAVENVRSFLDRQEMTFDGKISILIGPNGGGKTNLLDTIVTMLRRYLIATPYLEQVGLGDGRQAWHLQANQNLHGLNLEKHATAPDKPQSVELTVEVSESDLSNMRRIQAECDKIKAAQKKDWYRDPWENVHHWTVDAISAEDELTYIWKDGTLLASEDQKSRDFLQYLQIFEFDNACRYELKQDTLQLPMIYLPVNRAGNGFNSRVALSGFNDRDQKRQLDSITSRSVGTNIVSLAVGRLGKRYRTLELDDNMSVKQAFYADKTLQSLTAALSDLGYAWELTTVNPDTNEYDVTLKKQGTEFTAGTASSGEREILTYLFAIYALNVRDAVIVVDEPELHLHPRWQKILFDLFKQLSDETGNQFILATHSPTFVSPASIQYVSRVYAEEQKSRIFRLNATHLPEAKHLFNIVNSQNNERLFFCDKVILVEGMLDRIFFEKILARFGNKNSREVIEIVSIGGKYLFEAYRKLLDACRIKHMVIADLDYVEQVGTSDIKTLFRADAAEIKKDVIDNVGSLDGAALVARIDEAMASGNWENAQGVWAYIKSRRVKQKPDLSKEERASLDAFLIARRDQGTHILSQGALEDYLPLGRRGKRVDDLISFLEEPNYWDQLPLPNRNEIETLAKILLPPPVDAVVENDGLPRSEEINPSIKVAQN